jgi:hypothetical protein
MRVETGADIQVSKDDDLITIIGDEQSLVLARDAVVAVATRGPGRY